MTNYTQYEIHDKSYINNYVSADGMRAGGTQGASSQRPGVYQSKMHYWWTGKPVQQCILPVQWTGPWMSLWPRLRKITYGDNALCTKLFGKGSK